MCGILTYFSKDKITTPEHEALDLISHRGPDKAGLETFQVADRFLSLGHRRLSIIDLSERASQPMQYQESGLWITYNGEIYNYLELRETLEAKGYAFHTHSDTEVLLAAYRAWGESCLDQLNGMFAFCIWNQKTHELFVARDRYGIKPLYYWNTPQGFAIVSEVKQLTAFSVFQAKVHPEAAFQFLEYGDFSYNQATMFQDVYELEPGKFFCLQLDRWSPGEAITQKSWYDVATHISATPIQEEEARERFRELLQDAIRLRLRADVDLGVLLSGGLDSSSITCLMQTYLPKQNRLQAFSGCFEEPEFNEETYIDAVAEKTGVAVTKKRFSSSDLSASFDRSIWSHDFPTVGRSVYAHQVLYEKVSDGKIRVILEGQGADETLAGYDRFFWSYLSELLFSGHWLRARHEYADFREGSSQKELLGMRTLPKYMFPRFFDWYERSLRRGGEAHLFYALDRHPLSREKQRPFIQRRNDTVAKTHAARMLVLRNILHQVDRASMGHSIEARVPFLDHRLVAFCLSLPSSLKMKQGLRKYILRSSLDKELPPIIKNRRDKKGFSSPEAIWAKGPLKDFYQERLEQLKDFPLIRYQRVRKKFEAFLENKEPYDRRFWWAISFHRWMSLFRVSLS